ncbi:unnamed protein product [Gongylonema pulchrum]|uniref:MFS domain-containing protein n=1 Tax=Gongylonema pulchrum TaxID=637853 RepID=A0A183D8C1_9BILA|nr:unnamed protein product [Gongylonema pulchrum]
MSPGLSTVRGIAGVIWAIFWFALTFESPTFHPTISPEEKKYILDAIGPVSTTHPTIRRFSLWQSHKHIHTQIQ